MHEVERTATELQVLQFNVGYYFGGFINQSEVSYGDTPPDAPSLSVLRRPIRNFSGDTPPRKM